MSSLNKLIPTRFLTIIAHFAVALTILWSSHQSTKICLPALHTQKTFSRQHTQLILDMSLSIALIAIELLAFLMGLTMFNQSSALLSIGSHGLACVALTYLILDGMQCGWYWVIFGLFAVPPVINDFMLVAHLLINKKY